MKRMSNLARPGVWLGIFAVLAFTASIRAEEKEKTTAQLVAIVKNPTSPFDDRVAAISKLGEITDPAELRKGRVVDTLLEVATNHNVHIMVRDPAVKALGKLAINAEPTIKDRILPQFASILKDGKEIFIIRKSVAQVFKDILNPEGVPDKDAFNSLLEIAKNKNEVMGLRVSAFEAIGTFGSPSGLDVLVGALSDTEQVLRDAAARAMFDLLARMSPDTTVPPPAVNKLIEMLAAQTTQVDLKVSVMKLLAQLMNGPGTGPKQAMPEIIKIVATAQDLKLVRGGIEALGLVGTAEAVEPLKKAYLDFLPAAGAAPKDPAPAAGAGEAAALKPALNTKDTEIRQAVMKALSSVLIAQEGKKNGVDAKAVHEVASLVVKAIDSDPASQVVESAYFTARFLYSPKFEKEHKEVIDALIFKLADAKTTEELRPKIVEPLQYITGQDFGTDARRWDEWFSKRYNVPRAHKAAAPAKAEDK